MVPHAFISYAKEDIAFAMKLRNDLHVSDVSVWLDIYDLLPGERWEVAIRNAIKKSSFFIALLSTKSVRKRGYVQKELRQALSVAEEFPQDEVFIIPVRIDDCDPVHEDLRALQRVDLFPSYNDGLRTLRKVLKPEFELQNSGVTRQGKIARIGDRDFGFIKDNDMDKDIFFLYRDFASPNFPLITPGMHVRYQLKAGPLGFVAERIALV